MSLSALLKIKHSIIQAPMAGGISTAELASSVSNLGALGSLAGGYLSATLLEKEILNYKSKSQRPLNVNLFIPPADFTVNKKALNAAKNQLNPIYRHFSLIQKPFKYDNPQINFKQQIDMIIKQKIPICSFAFGLPSDDQIKRLKAAKITLIGTANSVDEAIKIEEKGFDAIVVQGSEAGGHRGGRNDRIMIGLFSLIPQARDAVSLPLIAAGGIMDRRGINAAKALGADGVQMGTAFLLTNESGAPNFYKTRLLTASEDQMQFTMAFTGKRARGLLNQFMQKMGESPVVSPFPLQGILTSPIVRHAFDNENPDYFSLWGGQSPRLGRMESVKELMARLVD